MTTENEPNDYYDRLFEFILDRWRKNGTVTDEEKSKACLESILFLLGGYRFKCLLKTLCDVDDLIEDSKSWIMTNKKCRICKTTNPPSVLTEG